MIYYVACIIIITIFATSTNKNNIYMWVLVTTSQIIRLFGADKIIQQYSDCTDDEKQTALNVNHNARLNKGYGDRYVRYIEEGL